MRSFYDELFVVDDTKVDDFIKTVYKDKRKKVST